jgi:hypothetical protein
MCIVHPYKPGHSALSTAGARTQVGNSHMCARTCLCIRVDVCGRHVCVSGMPPLLSSLVYTHLNSKQPRAVLRFRLDRGRQPTPNPTSPLSLLPASLLPTGSGRQIRNPVMAEKSKHVQSMQAGRQKAPRNQSGLHSTYSLPWKFDRKKRDRLSQRQQLGGGLQDRQSGEQKFPS